MKAKKYIVMLVYVDFVSVNDKITKEVIFKGDDVIGTTEHILLINRNLTIIWN